MMLTCAPAGATELGTVTVAMDLNSSIAFHGGEDQMVRLEPRRCCWRRPPSKVPAEAAAASRQLDPGHQAAVLGVEGVPWLTPGMSVLSWRKCGVEGQLAHLLRPSPVPATSPPIVLPRRGASTRHVFGGVPVSKDDVHARSSATLRATPRTCDDLNPVSDTSTA